MLPPEEYLIVDRTIRKNIECFDRANGTINEFTTIIMNSLGSMYYAIYERDINEMIKKIWNEQ